jgi:homoserine kinase
LSGAGPSVIVWARNEQAEACAAELRQRFPQEQILPLTISPTGAAAT